MFRDILFLFCTIVATILFAFRVDECNDDIKFAKLFKKDNLNELLVSLDINKKWFIFCFTMMIGQLLVILMQITC